MAGDASSSVKMEEVDVSLEHLSLYILLWSSVLSGWLRGEMSAVALLLVFLLPVVASLEACPATHHSVSAAVSLSPRLKTPKGPPGKVAHPISQDLCQKCFSPQVICYSLGPFHYYFKEPRKEREKREK